MPDAPRPPRPEWPHPSAVVADDLDALADFLRDLGASGQALLVGHAADLIR